MADDDISTATSSPEPSPAPSASEPATPSVSPPSEPTSESSGSPKETLLDAVLKVVPPTTETDVLAAPKDPASPETPDTPEDGQADTPEVEGDDDEDQKATAEATPRLRKKINKLLKERSELRSENETLKAMKPQAEIGSQIETFAKENDLSGTDVAFGMSVMAAARRGDYKAFYEAVSPYVRTAQEYLGIALPREVRERVSQGQMTEAAARELVRTQMDLRRAQTMYEADQQTSAQRHVQNVQDQVATSVSAFEQRLAANDPDYKAKAASVKRTAQAMIFERGGSIESVEQALQITKAAYDEVNATIRRQMPPLHATSRQPNGNGQTRSARPEPNSLMEAALQGLANARNGAGHP